LVLVSQKPKASNKQTKIPKYSKTTNMFISRPLRHLLLPTVAAALLLTNTVTSATDGMVEQGTLDMGPGETTRTDNCLSDTKNRMLSGEQESPLGDLALMEEAEIYNLTSFEEDMVPFEGHFGDLLLYNTTLASEEPHLDPQGQQLGNLPEVQNATEDSSGRGLACNSDPRLQFTSTLRNFATGRLLDSNGAGDVYTLGDNGGNFQRWKSYYNSCLNNYILQNQATGRVLDSNASGKVYTLPYKAGNYYQKWRRYNAGSGRYFFKMLPHLGCWIPVFLAKLMRWVTMEETFRSGALENPSAAVPALRASGANPPMNISANQELSLSRLIYKAARCSPLE
jgi:hypothetical protein